MHLALLLVLCAAPDWIALLEHDAVAIELRVQRRLQSVQERQAPEELLVVLQFRAPLSDRVKKRLAEAGVRFERVAGRLAEVGRFHGARLSPGGLAAVLAERSLLKVLPPAPHRIRPTPAPSAFAHVHDLTGARDIWPHRLGDGHRLTGAGVRICDMDSGVDVFHPSFFHADGGYYSWIDADGDGRYSVGSDTVDLDGDGVGTAGEELRFFGGGVVDRYSGTVDRPGTFVAGRHWLFADVNGNRQRDHGPASGFGDADPAFGEPLFVVDDVDRDGELDVGEKLIRLGSSKVVAVIREYEGRTYRRGVDLTQVPIHESIDHGTGVGGILVGGVYGQSRFMGVAPDAELIAVDQAPAADDPSQPVMSQVATASQALDLGALLMVHEYGTHVGMFADGSDPWEQFIDELSGQGVPQVTATHNFSGYGGKAQVVLAAGEQRELGMEVLDYGPGYRSVLIYLTLRWRGGDTADLDGSALVTPEGLELPLTASGADDLVVYSGTDRSERGTGMLYTLVYRPSGQSYLPLPTGDWTLRLVNGAGAAREVHASISDESAYAYLVHFTEAMTDLGTMAWPSTADSAISVGASAGNVPDDWEREGDLKAYSGRGPRIDGDLGIDVVAPEDHYTAIAPILAQHGDYQRFGGTSGALPQVAGAIALLLQLEPAITPAQVRARLQGWAATDSQTGSVPNDSWGHGRLDSYALLFEERASPNGIPSAAITGPSEIAAGESAVLSASSSSDDEDPLAQLTFRWDLDYDGTWDHEALGQPEVEVGFEQPGRHWIKLEVEDTDGESAQLLWTLDVTEPAPGADGGVGGGDGGDGGSGGLFNGSGPFGCGCLGGEPLLPWPWLGVGLVAAGWFRRRG